MTPGRLSLQSEFTGVPSHGSTFVYMITPQNVMPARVTRHEFTPVVVLRMVSWKCETTKRFGVKLVCW